MRERKEIFFLKKKKKKKKTVSKAHTRVKPNLLNFKNYKNNLSLE